MTRHHWPLFFFLLTLSFPALATDIPDSPETLVRKQIEVTEKVRLPLRFHEPKYLSAPGAKEGSLFVTQTAAVGSEGLHGPRITWLYEVSGAKTIRRFRFSFDAESLKPAEGPWPEVEGSYWVYDCLICSGPEGGYIYKVPVVARWDKKAYRLFARGSESERLLAKPEALRTIENAKEKYGKSRKEFVEMKRDVEALYGKGLFVPEAPATGK